MLPAFRRPLFFVTLRFDGDRFWERITGDAWLPRAMSTLDMGAPAVGEGELLVLLVLLLWKKRRDVGEDLEGLGDGIQRSFVCSL